MTAEYTRHKLAAARADPRSTAEIIAAALVENDEDLQTELISILQFRGDDSVFAATCALASSTNPHERRLAAAILSQHTVPDKPWGTAASPVLRHTLQTEDDPVVLQAAAEAFGSLDDPQAIRDLIALVHHPDVGVRWGVVIGLSGHKIAQMPEAVRALCVLSTDTDLRVRDWATFGLSTMSEVDNPELREALWARVTDNDDDTRDEAIKGLALRHDLRVVGALGQGLKAEDVARILVEAAKELADPALYEPLVALRSRWDVDTQLLGEAIAACRPSDGR